MVSGKYSALSGAISREQRLANIANNLANVNTVGYKKTRMTFESLLKGEQQVTKAKGINYSRVRENFTEFAPGPMKSTGNPLDIAIQDDGFFKVQSTDGPRYTRRGAFRIDQSGTLLAGNNLPVLGVGGLPITIQNTNTAKISVNSLGEISTLSLDGTRQIVGTIGIFSITDQAMLKRESDTLFSLKPGGLENPVAEPRLTVGSLEVSNVNMTEEMALMIESTRTFESYQKVIKAYSTLGKKQDELGSLG